MALKDLLADARRARGASLRDVERATGISNAYVSQLETGAVTEPSPKKLLALAEFYGVSYNALMGACGYLAKEGAQDVDSSASFMGEVLSVDESSAMAAFLHELRRRRRNKSR